MTIYIKSMVSNRCKMMVAEELKKMDIEPLRIDLGKVELHENVTPQQLALLKESLLHSGLEMLDDKKAILIEKVKNLITEMVQHSAELPKLNYSNYISEKIGYDYTYLANIFSEVNGVTIQQFIIRHKIEKVKELLLYGELSLTEISNKLHYSSVGHLSNQFKKFAGLSPSLFKEGKHKRVSSLENL